MGRRTWIKVYSDKWLRGTINKESLEVKGAFISLLAMASDSPYENKGEILITSDIGYTDEQYAKILNTSTSQWAEIKTILMNTQRISADTNNIIYITNWTKYQSEYERQKSYRGKLQSKVTKKVTVKKRETRREKQEKINKKDNNDKNEKKKDIARKKKEKKPSSSNPDIKIFIDSFFNSFRNKFGYKYLVQGGKDSNLVKRMLGTYSLQELLEFKSRFFKSDDDFIEKAGYTIGVFSSQISKLIGNKEQEPEDHNSIKGCTNFETW